MSVRKNINLIDIVAQNEITGNKLLSKKQRPSCFSQVHILKKSNKDSGVVTYFWEKMVKEEFKENCNDLFDNVH